MAMDADPQVDPQSPTPSEKPAKRRKRTITEASSASQHEVDITADGGFLDEANLPPPAADDTPASGSPRVTVPPPPGGYAMPANQAPPAQSAPPPTPVRSGPSAGQRIGRALTRLFGWLLAIVFGIAIALLLFALAPVAYQRIIAPVTENTQGLAQLNEDVSQLAEDIDAIQEEQVAQDRALIDAESSAEQRIADAEGRLADTEGRLRDTEDDLAEQARVIADLEETLDQQAAQLDELNTTLAQLQEELPGQAEYDEYNRQLLLMRAWQELLRARLRLLENNAGQALDELEAAQGTMSQVYAISTPKQQADLEAVIERIEMVVVEITENPFAATGDLEIAWQMLGELITPPGVIPAATEAPTEAPEATEEP
jgi:hypothetical protein